MSQPRSPAPILAAAQAEPLPELSQICDRSRRPADHMTGGNALDLRAGTSAGVQRSPGEPSG
jgi:hypothetical protein